MADSPQSAAAQEAAFAAYKQAESQAGAIVAEMRRAHAKPVDIELALLTAIFELHKGRLPPVTIGKVIGGHLETLVPYYQQLLARRGDEPLARPDA